MKGAGEVGHKESTDGALGKAGEVSGGPGWNPETKAPAARGST